ncbi:YbfB/YjiJ family MFS transporter [Pseudomonadota bacterium]
MDIFIVRFVGFCSTLVGVGFARMAFTPLSASAIYEGVIPITTTAIVGAMLMTTYALGACCSGGLLQRIGSIRLIRGCLILAFLCQLLELTTPSLELWLITRGVYGLVGGCLMVAGPIIAISAGTKQQISRTPLWTFLGIGGGALVAATLLQLPLSLSIQQNILLLFMFVITLSVLFVLPKISTQKQKRHDNSIASTQPDKRVNRAVLILIVAYTFDALGYVPATIYLSDFAANQLDMGRDAGNTLWQCFGLGALVSMPILSFIKLDKFTEVTLLFIYVIKTFALFLLFTTNQFFLLALASFLTGLAVPAIVLLTATLLRQWLHFSAFSSVWHKATASFSVGQAVSALAMAAIYGRTHDYEPLFKAGAMLVCVSTALIMILTVYVYQTNRERACT